MPYCCFFRILALFLAAIFPAVRGNCAEPGVGAPPVLIGPEPMRNNPAVDLRNHVRPGEKLIYIAKWNGFPGGTITTTVWPVLREFDGHPVFMFDMTMESNDFLTMFYPVRTTIRSLADAGGGWSYLFRRRVKEGDYQGNDRVLFDYSHMNELGKLQPQAETALIRSEQVEKQEPRAIPGRLCDPLTLAWYMRTLNLNARGDMATVLIGDRYGNGLVTLTVTGVEQVQVAGMGRFEALVVRPDATTYDGKESLIKSGGQVRFWLERHTRILLRAEADIPVGRAGVTLISQEKTPLERFRLPDPAPEEKKNAPLPAD